MFECPHCQKGIDDVMSVKSHKEEVDRRSKIQKQLETDLAESQRATKRLTAQAERVDLLAAKLHKFDVDEDTVSVLHQRHKKAQESGFDGDFEGWLSSENGASADKVASRLRLMEASPPKSDAAKPPAEPKPKPVLPASTTDAITPATTPKMTYEQIQKINEPLMAQRKAAIIARNKSLADQLTMQIQENIAKAG